mmetsp:Transcript_4021/g.8924  ORF Transcript_4021/g.8924 Transcript_4021/m.8924 type:complete len:255 (-) Transcript_4021:1533-2297(-)
MPLPSRSIDEILEKASTRQQEQEVPSPRGVADFPNDFAARATGNKKVAGSLVECLEYADNCSALRHFPNKETAICRINNCAERFLMDVLKKTITIVEYSHRMTVHTGDVACALDLFAEVDADDCFYGSFPSATINEEYIMKYDTHDEDEDDNSDEDWEEGNDRESEDIVDEEMVVAEIDESDESMKFDLKSTSAPVFEASYPFIHEIEQLSDKYFHDKMVMPVLEELKAVLKFSKGVDGLLKSAMHAFLVAKLL